MADEQERWVNAAVILWERTAPSYVQASVKPDRLTLRGLHRDGATLEQFDEALKHAFRKKDITKRNALRYAVGIVRTQLREANDGA